MQTSLASYRYKELRHPHDTRSQISILGFSCDGKLLLTASPSKDKSTITIWSMPQRKLGKTDMLRTWPISGLLFSAAWSPRMAHLFVTAEQRQLRVWDAKTGQAAFSLHLPHDPHVLTWHPLGAALVVTNAQDAEVDRLVCLAFQASPCKLRVSREVRTEDETHSLAFVPKGGELMFRGGPADIQVFSWQNMKLLRKLQGHAMPVTCLATSLDCRWLAAGSVDASLSLWDLDEMAAVWSRSTIDGGILSITFSYGSAMLAYTEDKASAVTHLDTASGAVRFQNSTKEAPLAAAWSSKGPMLAFCGSADRKKAESDMYSPRERESTGASSVTLFALN